MNGNLEMAATRLMRCLFGVLVVLGVAAACASSAPASGGEGGGAAPPLGVSGLNGSTAPEPPLTSTTAASTTLPSLPEAAATGEFVAVSAGWGYTCGLRGDGAVECWRWGENGSEPGEGFPWSTAVYHRLSSPWTFEEEKTALGLRWDASPQAAEPPAGAFAAVSVGRDAACGLRPSGSMECWGHNQAFADAPSGVFAAVSVGIEHACALRRSGLTECWGTSNVRGNAATPPEGKYSDIATGDYFVCGLQAENGTAECWGDGFTIEHDLIEYGQGVVPPGRFTSINAGGSSHVCGLRENGTAECWASHSPEYEKRSFVQRFPEYSAYLTPPRGEFTTINVNGSVACGMRPGGKHECWGVNGWGFPVPPGDFLTVGRGGGGYWGEDCGALRSGGVECWDSSNETVGEGPPETRRDAEGVFTKLSTSDSHKCGLRSDGSVECWTGVEEWNDYPVMNPPGGVFVDISLGEDHACGLRRSGAVECWGSEAWGKASPPPGEFTKVSASIDFTCGLRRSGEIQCWGSEAFPQSKILPPPEPLTTISAGWGGYRFRLNPGSTGGPYTNYHFGGIENDWGYTCGLRPDHTPRCWGDPARRYKDHWPQILDPPRGEFLKVQTGRWHACGLRSDGKIECWGNSNVSGQEWAIELTHTYNKAGIYPEKLRTNGPQHYIDLSVGGTHTCGLRSDRDIECWGNTGTNTLQQQGPYTALSAGYTHQCGLHATGHIHCWETNDPNNIWRTQTYKPTTTR